MSTPCPNCGRLNRPGARYCASCQTPLSATSAELQAGQLLDGGTYRVVRPLGKGGMGAVWLVAQTKAFDRLAVIKEVIDYFDPADAEERRKALQRFEAEARTLGDLKHPGIPDLYAYFSEGGHNYLVMEYIEGQDLRLGLTREDGDSGQLVAGGPRPADEALLYTIQICEVLEYLASRQPPVIHNDIKPGNIIIDQNGGRAVLVDFGTAKTRYVKAAGRPDGDKESLYGTVGYAAPELFRGQAVPRSDVYSLAATAYHLLTDDDPRDHPMQYPQLDTLSPALADILRRALAEEIADRLTATEFRQALEAYLAGQTGPLQALTFPGGDAANSREELLTLMGRHWSYAAGILQDGTLVRWLRGTVYDQAAAHAAEGAVKRWPNNPDAALDDFLRQLAPAALPPAKMEVGTPSLVVPAMGANQRMGLQIQVANKGRGYLRGEVFSSQPWARVKAGAFACPPGEDIAVPIEIDGTALPAGGTYLAAVTLAPAFGTPEVVPVQVTVIAASIRVTPTEVDFGIVARRDLSTARRRVVVTNDSRVTCQCRVVGAPQWLLVRPEAFRLQPGAQQDVEFVGRVDRLRARRYEVPLRIAVGGGQDQQIVISLRVRRGLSN